MDDNDKLYALYLRFFAFTRSGAVLTGTSFQEMRERTNDEGLKSTRTESYSAREMVAVARGVVDGHRAVTEDAVASKSSLIEFIKSRTTG